MSIKIGTADIKDMIQGCTYNPNNLIGKNNGFLKGNVPSTTWESQTELGIKIDNTDIGSSYVAKYDEFIVTDYDEPSQMNRTGTFPFWCK